MAKSIGKYDVLVETFLDGASQGQRVERRVVYQDGETFKVNYLNGKRQIQRQPNGSFYWPFHIHTLKAVTIDEVIERLFKSTTNS